MHVGKAYLLLTITTVAHSLIYKMKKELIKLLIELIKSRFDSHLLPVHIHTLSSLGTSKKIQDIVYKTYELYSHMS